MVAAGAVDREGTPDERDPERKGRSIPRASLRYRRLRDPQPASGEFSPPSFEATMARKDVRLMIEEAQRHNVDLPVMRGVAAAYDEAIGRGDGALDSSAVARV